MGSHISLCLTFDIEIIWFYKKNYKKVKKNVCPKGELNPGPWDLKASVLTTELLCHYIEFGKKKFEYTFQCKMRKSQFSQQDVSWFHKLWWFWIWFCMRHKWRMSADWKNKCWFTIYNKCFIYDSNIYFGAFIWFFVPSPAST